MYDPSFPLPCHPLLRLANHARIAGLDAKDNEDSQVRAGGFLQAAARDALNGEQHYTGDTPTRAVARALHAGDTEVACAIVATLLPTDKELLARQRDDLYMRRSAHTRKGTTLHGEIITPEEPTP